eukprot:3249480-Rhodomonas_salina.1
MRGSCAGCGANTACGTRCERCCGQRVCAGGTEHVRCGTEGVHCVVLRVCTARYQRSTCTLRRTRPTA